MQFEVGAAIVLQFLAFNWTTINTLVVERFSYSLAKLNKRSGNNLEG